MPNTRGLPLPSGLVQPFFLRFRSDDFHVMAFFRGHPVYEAVEAMIGRRADGSFAVRAILTRHDQTQIDHVNDRRLAASIRGAAREICETAIDVKSGERDNRPRMEVEFASFAGERIVLDVTAVEMPTKAGAGLTDPGTHSLTASLPIMWRGASTLASPDTRVEIDGCAFTVPEKLRTPRFTALEGYFTEHHAMGAFRAGTETITLIETPKVLEAGASWQYFTQDESRRYVITARPPDGSLRIERSGEPREIIFASAIDDSLVVHAILIPADKEDEGLALSFPGEERFTAAIGGRKMISGRVACDQNAGETVVRLSPANPSWAVNRKVCLTCERKGDDFRLTTQIGSRAQPPDG